MQMCTMSFIWFCAAGYSLFCGIALLTLTMLFSILSKQLWPKLLVHVATIISIFLIILSATPLPWWLYIVWVISVLGWLLFFASEKLSKWPFTKLLTALAFCVTITVLVTELPFYLKPTMPKHKFEKLYIIGDSVSAGIGGKHEQTWPILLRNKYGIKVVDLSESGATVTSAIHQANQVNSENTIVLLEIGGNDLFGSTPYSQFKRDLSQILNIVSDYKSTVVMLELPIFPWHIEYGRIQRQLAKQFNVILIPKHFFVSVLSVKGASTDLAHLSAKGHQLMVETIWSILGPNLISTVPEKK